MADISTFDAQFADNPYHISFYKGGKDVKDEKENLDWMDFD